MILPVLNSIYFICSFGNLFLRFLLFVFIKFIAFPYSLLRFYKKQGGFVQFFPFAASFVYDIKDVQTHKSFFYRDKQIIKENPNLKFLATNLCPSCYLVLADPKILKDFFNQHDYYKKAEMTAMYKNVLGNGIFFSEEDSWERRRRLISKSFHYEFIRAKLPYIKNIVKEILDDWEKNS